MRRTSLLLVVLGLVTAACSGAAADDGVATLEIGETAVVPETTVAESATEADQEQAMLDFAACMRDNGVDIEDPTVDAEGNVQFGRFGGQVQEGEIDRDALDTAFVNCQEHLEGIALGRGGGDFDLTELEDTMVEYAACMRENGYDMADPDFSNFGPGAAGGGGQGGGGPFGDIDLDDPDFITAQEACQDILAGFRGPGQGGGGRPGGQG